MRDFLLGILRRTFRPRPDIKIGEWAKLENVQLSSKESHGGAGVYDPDAEPTASVIFDFAVDPRYDILVGLKPSRMGFTLAASIVMCFWIRHYSQNVIFCIDNAKQVQRFGRERIVPLLRSIRGLRDVIPASDKKLTSKALYLNGITAYLAGAKSISDVTSVTAGLVIGDEVDQWEEFASGEASAYYHLQDRIMDVPGAKAMFFGKPRNEEDILWNEYLTGTRHKCFVPCPNCNHYQTLEFPRLKFDHCKLEDGSYDLDRVLRECYYECMNPACSDRRITEGKKSWMLSRLEWRQTNFGQDEQKPEPRKMSVHVNHLYALRAKLTWGVIAVHFLKAQKSGGTALAHFYRTRMGEPRRQTQSVVKHGDLLKLVGTYKHGQCPFRPVVVVMSCDVQNVEKKWVKAAFHRDGRCAVIDYGIEHEFGALYDIINKPVHVLDWEDAPENRRENPKAKFCWIDEGGKEGNEKEVREFCARKESFGRFFPSKGAGGAQIKTIVQESLREVSVNWRPSGRVVFNAYHFSHSTFATELYQARIGKHDEIVLAMEKGVDPPAPRLYFPKNPDDQFLKELCAEPLIQKRIRGELRWVWDKSGVNDFGDGLKGCLAMWYYVKGFIPAAKSKGRDYVLKRD